MSENESGASPETKMDMHADQTFDELGEQGSIDMSSGFTSMLAEDNENFNSQFEDSFIALDGAAQFPMNMNHPGMNNSVMDEAAMNNPGMNNSVMDESAMNNPGMNNPGMNNPGMNNPGMNNPGMNNPGMNNPGMNNPGMNYPVMDESAMPQTGTSRYSLQGSAFYHPVAFPSHGQPQTPAPAPVPQTLVAPPVHEAQPARRHESNQANAAGSRAQQGTVTRSRTAASNETSSRAGATNNKKDSSPGEGSNQKSTSQAKGKPSTSKNRKGRGGEGATSSNDCSSVRWTTERRIELLMQVAYERRHESMSEGAWQRIAQGTRKGPWMHASWNGVRLEFSRLMTERFDDYGRSPQARARRQALEAAAAAQEAGHPSTVPEAQIRPGVSDADIEPPPPRKRPRKRQVTPSGSDEPDNDGDSGNDDPSNEAT